MNTDDLTAMKMLAAGRTAAFVAAALDLAPDTVAALIDRHGVTNADGSIDRDAAHAAATALANSTTPALPTREPAPTPAVPAPAAPLRPVADGAAGVLLQVALTRVRPDPDNPRREVGDVTELAASLTEVGMLQPIVARRTTTGALIVVAGHRRLAAAKAAGWNTVPVIVRQDMRPAAVLAAMLVENGHRRDLDPIEEAHGLARLKGQLGCNEAQLARRLGRAQSHVSARLRLLALPIDEQEALRRGEMTLTEAKDRARVTTGRIGASTGRPSINHFSTVHPLAAAAKARCLRLGHARGRGKGVGGIACGACWESVIRADERGHLHELSGARNACVLCGHALPEPTTTTSRRNTA